MDAESQALSIKSEISALKIGLCTSSPAPHDPAGHLGTQGGTARSLGSGWAPQAVPAHLQLQGGAVHSQHLGEDAGAQRGAVILVERPVHVLVQQRGLAHAGDKERGR